MKIQNLHLDRNEFRVVATFSVTRWWWPFPQKKTLVYYCTEFGHISRWNTAPWFNDKKSSIGDAFTNRVLTAALKQAILFDKALEKKSMKKDTRTDLVVELEKVPPTPLVMLIIQEAKDGEYHDFKNRKYVCGKVALAGLLKQAGLEELRQQVLNGDYDEPADEEDKAELRKGLSPAMQKAFGL